MTKRYDLVTARTVGDKTYWTRIGAMFPNKNGDGFSLLFEALPLPTKDKQTGEYVVRVSALVPKATEKSSEGDVF